ncbi:MAG: T9SS type A sorting domain-containing protein, partial [Bacteroidales bacterium]|nr:T9SS type A sorting domain-containing protein [Bacteroidales bacterium]
VFVNEIIAGPIAHDSVVSYTFTEFADFSISGQLDSVQAKVRLDNDQIITNDSSVWVSTYSITPASLPYSIDFESPDQVAHWKTIDGNEDGRTWFIGNSSALAYSGSGVAAINSDESTAIDDWFISTCINLTQGYYSISYWYRTQYNQHPENFKIAYGTEQTAAGMTHVLNDHSGITNNTYTKGQKIFSVPTTGVYYFGIHGYSLANSSRIMVDDISIDVSTGINETKFTSKIYPNPATKNIRIESNQFIKTIRIVNVLGQEVYNKAISNYGTEINLSNFHSGIYFVNIETSQGTTTQRISVIK